MNQTEKTFAKVLLAIIFIGLLASMTSCRTSGYGCKGRESWKYMIKRINRP